MTLEEMQNRRKELGYSLESLAKITGVPLSTIRKIFSGQTKAPRRDTIGKLTAILEVKKPYSLSVPVTGLSEGAAVYGGSALQVDNPYGNKMQGEYTVEDYLALPDDKRYELIDGVIYEMAAPSLNHQDIAGYLYYRLMRCAEEAGSPCHPYISPLDVQLDRDNRTMVQPDVVVCCDRALDSGERVYGAPEYVAEVVSPSSRKRDRFIKYLKYKNAGVREYWMIEPARLQVIVYLFEKDDDIRIYTFDEDIPVSISDGKCKINLSGVKAWLSEPLFCDGGIIGPFNHEIDG